MKCYGAKLNINNNGPSNTGRGSLMHTFGISVIITSFVIEGKESITVR